MGYEFPLRFINDHIETILGIIITTIISVILAQLAKPKTRISYHILNKKILDINEHIVSESITILVNNLSLKKLIKTELRIWNDGSTIIRGEDKIKENPLRIHLDDAQIVSINIIKNSDKDNNFSIKKSCESNEFILDFDYLEPKSGVLIEFLHNKENPKIDILGKVIGLKNNQLQNSRYRFNSLIAIIMNYWEWICFLFLLWIVALLPFIGFAFIANKYPKFSILLFLGLFIFAYLPAIIIPKFKRFIGTSVDHPNYLK